MTAVTLSLPPLPRPPAACSKFSSMLNESHLPSRSSRLVGTDGSDDGSATPDGAREAGSDGASDAPTRADSAPTSDAQEGGLPPTCTYGLENVDEVNWPNKLCGATSKGTTYSFGSLRFRRPVFDPPPIEAFTDGVLTVKNGATVMTYMGASWQDPEGEQIRFTGPGGTTSIVLQAGVNEISVTTHDVSAKTGCLPQPCTWTVSP